MYINVTFGYMIRRRIPLEIQEELRAYYAEIVPKIIPGLGFNPFIRALLFFFSDLNNHLIQHIIHRGAELERDFKKGSYELNPAVIEVEIGCSKTERALFDYMAEYVKPPYDIISFPEDEPDSEELAEAQAWWLEERERLKEELREEILDGLRKPPGEGQDKS